MTSPKKERRAQHWSHRLPADACGDSRDWCTTQPSMKAAWKNCERGDWMLWLLGRLGRLGADHKRRVLAACACARLSLRYVPRGEKRPSIAIKTAEKWARGEATLEEVRVAAYAAEAASVVVRGSSAANANAIYASYAAACVEILRAPASAATFAARAAATFYRGPGAYDKTLAKCADIVREHFPRTPRLVPQGRRSPGGER